MTVVNVDCYIHTTKCYFVRKTDGTLLTPCIFTQMTTLTNQWTGRVTTPSELGLNFMSASILEMFYFLLFKETFVNAK